MTGRVGTRPRLLHVCTVDMSLELLLGPQLRAFANAGYEVIGASAPGPFVERLGASGIRHIALEHASRAMDPRADLRLLRELRDVFKRERPDIVHTHNPKPGVYGRLAARAAGVPVVVNTVHGIYAQPTDPASRRLPIYALERLAAACSHAELVQNPEDVDTLVRTLRVPRRRVALLGNGVDLDRFDPERLGGYRPTRRAELELPPDAVVIGAVGRLVAEKGYPELFEAMDRVRSRHPEAVLVVLGPDDPSKSDALDRGIVRRAEAAGVRFLGMRDDVETWYPAFDVYVLASHREGFPRSAMEAAALGLPIVTTDIRGCRQVVTHDRNGLLVPVEDPASLADALERVVGDAALRRTFGNASRRRALDEFDDRRQIALSLATYERLLDERGGAR